MVVPESIPEEIAEMRYSNANDGTCEGIDYRTIPAFTVQFHPEAAAGPLDTGFLFDRFTELMGAHKYA
jgi:carbamoyl-phosphate synthase small subunit